MKAIVNGKEMELTPKKKYHNGIETIYECVTKDGVWVAVGASAVLFKARTKIEYSGSRAVDGAPTRNAVVTITTKTEEEAEVAYERLMSTASQYEAAMCSNVEKTNDGYYITEHYLIDNKQDFLNFKKYVYNIFKQQVKG